MMGSLKNTFRGPSAKVRILNYHRIGLLHSFDYFLKCLLSVVTGHAEHIRDNLARGGTCGEGTANQTKTIRIGKK